MKRFYRKRTIIAISMIFAILFSVLCIRGIGLRMVNDYLRQKYEGNINFGNVSVNKIGLIHISDRAWPIFLEYDGIAFQVDIINNTDDFVEKYTETQYVNLILAEYQGENISKITIPFVQTMGLSDRLALDNQFFLEVTFDQTVNDKESFVNGVEEILSSLRRSGLSRCDTLEAFAYIDGRLRHIRLSPCDNAFSSKDIYDSIDKVL